ncbi:uncharacterized protein BYT42DRAFT_514100 [Radiomyces spectabilis]|uniref:uncharacterized protein n=1 Tax=Radiomyces spectabilis TaxID=64574 RepID=UPI00221FF122|nr:uncharacterized protein BYT42DRAFT_514100 [Radiomyces spectabilis]KAI8381597.1 hypothetical protein BYT42DRAFT_514100 [Radiomyces spectabilis]
MSSALTVSTLWSQHPTTNHAMTMVHSNDPDDMPDDYHDTEDMDIAADNYHSPHDEEDVVIGDCASSMSSSPSIPDENINFDLVYALHTFAATVEGQASVVKGDALILMEDTNTYWWLVEVLKTREIGYIPAENIETPYERLARLNKHRNVEITSPSMTHDVIQAAHSRPNSDNSVNTINAAISKKKVTIATDGTLENIIHYEVESDIEHDSDSDTTTDDDRSVEYGQDQISQDEMTDHEDEQNPLLTHPSGTRQEDADGFRSHNPEISSADSPSRTHCSTITKQECSVAPSLDTTAQNANGSFQEIRVFAGNIGQGPLFHSFEIASTTTADELLKEAVRRFNIQPISENQAMDTIEYYLAVQGMDGDDYILASQDKPSSIFRTLTASLTTPMPPVSHLRHLPTPHASESDMRYPRRPRSSSFGNHEQTSYEEDSVIRFYLHRRIKRANQKQGLIYIKVTLYPDENSIEAANNLAVITENPTMASTKPFSTFGKRMKKMMAAPSEIDRIDKIIPVQQDLQIRSVINIALEKFHVPHAEADSGSSEPLHPLESGISTDPQSSAKYRMSFRSHNSKELELNPESKLGDVIQRQRDKTSSSTEAITSDLFFILRKIDPSVSTMQRRKQSSSGLTGIVKVTTEPRRAPFLTANNGSPEDRRPSILDILMDSPHPSSRRASSRSSLLDSSPTPEERRPSLLSNSGSFQEQRSASGSSNSSPTMGTRTNSSLLAPPSSNAAEHSRHSSLVSSSNHSNASFDDQGTLTDNPTRNGSINSQATYNKSPDGNPADAAKKSKASLKQQFKRLVGWGVVPKTKRNEESYVSGGSSIHNSALQRGTAVIQQNNSAIIIGHANMDKMDSVLQSNISLASAPVSSPPHSNAYTSFSADGSRDNKPSDSANTTVVPEPFARTDRKDESSDISALTATSATTGTSTSVDDGEMDDKLNINHELDDELTSDVGSESFHGVHTGENDASIAAATETEDIHPLEHTTMRKRESKHEIIDNVLSNQASTTGTYHLGGADHSGSAVLPPHNDDPATPQTDVPSMNSVQQHQGFDDLFLLVTQGVDYLKSRESSKWDDEEGGYRYHPWNRPESSFAASSGGRSRSLDVGTPSSLPLEHNALLDYGNEKHEIPSDIAEVSNLSASLTEEKPLSPPLTPIPRQPQEQRLDKQSAPATAGGDVDDEELKRIVASHIVFF